MSTASAALPLRPSGGEIHGHIAENAATGLPRGLYWALTIDFEPIAMDGEEQRCSLSVEWVTWPAASWRALDGMDLATVVRPELLESSLYWAGEHRKVTLSRLALRAVGEAEFVIDFAGEAIVRDATGRRTFSIAGDCTAPFTHIIVVPSNLAPEPRTAAQIRAVVADFISPGDLREPDDEGWRLLFAPRA